MAAQNNAIRIILLKHKLIICDRIVSLKFKDKNEMIYPISECNKLAQKEYKTRYDWVGKVIHWELYKRLKFDQTDKRYMHSPESILENETDEIL